LHQNISWLAKSSLQKVLWASGIQFAWLQHIRMQHRICIASSGHDGLKQRKQRCNKPMMIGFLVFWTCFRIGTLVLSHVPDTRKFPDENELFNVLDYVDQFFFGGKGSIRDFGRCREYERNYLVEELVQDFEPVL
jgi:hypothetical protein